LLSPNNYNPNAIAPPELELLKLSIIEDGWTMPIVTLPEQDGRFVIVDGFHRWKISADPKVYALTDGLVPTVQVGLDPIHQQMSTIRHNRARGTHGVLKMAQIVRSMLADGVTEKEW
jgi:ParB-like chromosome segregation protein Spo0J